MTEQHIVKLEWSSSLTELVSYIYAFITKWFRIILF